MKTEHTKPGIPKYGDHGFTLIEVMIAIAIFSIGFLAISSMQITSINENASSRLRTEATALAIRMNERLMMLPYSDAFLASGDHPADQPIPAGFDSESRYSVSYFIKDATPTANTKTIQVQVSWEARGRTNTVTIDSIRVDL